MLRPRSEQVSQGWHLGGSGHRRVLLEYADETGELPVAPIPLLLARNGTFMVCPKMQAIRDTLPSRRGSELAALERRGIRFLLGGCTPAGLLACPLS
jgi:hypothetical protein